MKTIKSRYSLTTINSNNFGTLQISGTSQYPMLTTLSGGNLTQGYVFVPYIISNVLEDIIMKRKLLREERIQKLNKVAKNE